MEVPSTEVSRVTNGVGFCVLEGWGKVANVEFGFPSFPVSEQEEEETARAENLPCLRNLLQRQGLTWERCFVHLQMPCDVALER